MVVARRNFGPTVPAIVLSLIGIAEGGASAQQNPLPVERRPLITAIYTADPSAHVFDGELYIYPSHDIPTDVPSDMNGSQYDMKDYHVFSLTNFVTPVVDHGEALNVKDVPWASNEMWAPDAAFKNGTYYLYFPAHDKDGIFRIGVATSKSPAGPFKAEANPIKGSFSIDPAVFIDDDGAAYMYFGGLHGGQLERWQTGTYDAAGTVPSGRSRALGPRVARLASNMLGFDGPIREAVILGADGQPLPGMRMDERFFEASWMHKYRGTYYLSYSTGETHLIVYATGKSPIGPFTYRGAILTPVVGWTTHHSIVEYRGKWYLFYHDASLSGEDNERCVKFQELHYDDDGSIQTLSP
jgi:hypothetical protein